MLNRGIISCGSLSNLESKIGGRNLRFGILAGPEAFDGLQNQQIIIVELSTETEAK